MVPFEGWPLVVKRTLDILISFTVLVFSVPLFLMVGLLVSLTRLGQFSLSRSALGSIRDDFQCISSAQWSLMREFWDWARNRIVGGWPGFQDQRRPTSHSDRENIAKKQYRRVTSCLMF